MSANGGRMEDFTEPVQAEPVVGEVVALRQFTVHADGVLRGLLYAQPTLDGINVARCYVRHPKPGHDVTAPSPGCRCGFYAYDYPQTWLPGTGGRVRAGSTRIVTAAVELSGRVIVCKRGLKAQKMRVIALTGWTEFNLTDDSAFPVADSDEQPSLVSLLRAHYPDVEFFATQKDMLEAHPLAPTTQAAREHADRPATLFSDRIVDWPAAPTPAWSQQRLTRFSRTTHVFLAAARTISVWSTLAVFLGPLAAAGALAAGHLAVSAWSYRWAAVRAATFAVFGYMGIRYFQPHSTLVDLGATTQAVTTSLILALITAWMVARIALNRRNSSQPVVVVAAPAPGLVRLPSAKPGMVAALVEGDGVRPPGITFGQYLPGLPPLNDVKEHNHG